MRKLIIAHRGANRLAHENTLAAFQKAIDLGADMVELDVRKLGDGTIVVFHDASMTGINLNRLNFAELNALAKRFNFSVPTLEQVCRLLNGKIKLNAELKESGYENEIGVIILKNMAPGDVLVSSFDSARVINFKKLYPNVKIGLIVGINWRDFAIILKLIFSKKFSGQFSTLNVSWFILEWGIIRLFKLAGQSVMPWTVDRPGDIKKYLADPRIAGIFTNVPEIAVKIRDNL